jgi:2-(1,2-epoxy-1,2-dihydrophenyl)acetyl-CoA isomerase
MAAEPEGAMQKQFERVRLAARGTVAFVTLDHPDVMNAISPEMARGLTDALGFASDEANGFRAILLTGEGRAFCAGANLGERPERTEGPIDAGAHLEKHYHPLLLAIRDLRLPFVTAVNGAAAGVGMSLALTGDIILAARSAYFLQAFARIGLVPDGGSTWLLPRLVGLARARELSLFAERLPAETALAWGLINRVCEDATLLDEAVGLAARLADGPTSALAATRRLYWASPDNSFEKQLEMERQEQSRAGRTKDFAEGVTAFLQKRPPRFMGQ